MIEESTLLAVTGREAAKMLSISERTLWSLWQQGELTRIHIGRSVRYPVADLVAFIDRQRKAARPRDE